MPSGWLNIRSSQAGEDDARARYRHGDAPGPASDKAPDQWKPPLVAFWCTYATDWIVVKHYYGLTVTQGEKTALTDMLRRC